MKGIVLHSPERIVRPEAGTMDNEQPDYTVVADEPNTTGRNITSLRHKVIIAIGHLG